MLFKNTYQLKILAPHHSHTLYLISHLLFILNQNKIAGLHISISYLPKSLKKFTLLKSPHVHKTARTQLELRTTRTLVKITNICSQKTQTQLTKVMAYLIRSVPLGTKITLLHSIQQFI